MTILSRSLSWITLLGSFVKRLRRFSSTQINNQTRKRIGEGLCTSRKQLGLSLEQAAERLHVDAKELEFIESGDWDELRVRAYRDIRIERYAQLLANELQKKIGESLRESRKKNGINLELAAKDAGLGRKEDAESIESGEWDRIAEAHRDISIKNYADSLNVKIIRPQPLPESLPLSVRLAGTILLLTIVLLLWWLLFFQSGPILDTTEASLPRAEEASASIAVPPIKESTDEPAATSTIEPTDEPTVTPTTEPTDEPTATPTIEPTDEPMATPTTEPTDEPTATPTIEPTDEPTATPTTEPTPIETPLMSRTPVSPTPVIGLVIESPSRAVGDATELYKPYILRVIDIDPGQELRVELRTSPNHPDLGTRGFNIYIVTHSDYLNILTGSQPPTLNTAAGIKELDSWPPVSVARIIQPFGEFYVVLYRESEPSVSQIIDIVNGSFRSN